MEFDINSYPDSNMAMCCRSYEETIKFSEYLNSVGRQWCNCKAYTDPNPRYQLSSEDNGFCFVFNQGLWDRETDLIEQSEEEWQILHFSDFSWSAFGDNADDSLESSPEMDVFLSQFTS